MSTLSAIIGPTLEVSLDQDRAADPPANWLIWVGKQFQKADFIVFVCSKAFTSPNQTESARRDWNMNAISLASGVTQRSAATSFYDDEMVNQIQERERHLFLIQFDVREETGVPQIFQQFPIFVISSKPDPDEFGVQHLARYLCRQEQPPAPIAIPPIMRDRRSEEIHTVCFETKKEVKGIASFVCLTNQR